ncbi:MAG TPA: MFS transporter [Caldilineaceae bacterium]|nr:MFS transporter [Caldilineaceae bacterium]
MNDRQAFSTAQRRLWPRSALAAATAGAPVAPWDTRAILIGLMVPMGMTVLNLSMFGVALPFIRDSFRAEADIMAWLVTAYTLPFVLFMPLYGRLGDGLGKRRLFSIGIILFFAGACICLLAQSMGQLILGRMLQGIGTAGVNPLCIAIISELFPDTERGRALGTWSSTGPATSMIAPFLGGFLVDQWGWHSIFLAGLIASLAALYVVRGRVPKLAPAPQPGFLRRFDWTGMALLSGAIVGLVGYLSSRSLTGVEPLRDWRLAGVTLLLTVAFLLWERRSAYPLVPLGLFRLGQFSRASLAAGVRMVLMSTESFLIPLYLADVYDLNAATVGLLLTLQAGALLTTVRMGGRLADSWSRRWPVLIGFTVQVGVMVYFANLPAGAPLWSAGAGLIAHGLAAGLSLAVLHRVAMDPVPAEMAGAAAGLYSMARFFGSIIGATLGGVVLTQALAEQSQVIDAYHIGFWFVAALGALGILAVAGFKDQRE